MCKIEIYCVTTEVYRSVNKLATLSKLAELEELKKDLSAKYGGLTIFRNVEGLWLDNGQLYVDRVEVWRILTSDLDAKYIDNVAQKLKAICEQKSQLYTINDEAHFI